ncbi:hypothetical protein OSTOST_15876 [Ostertagia ostertagi]
MVLVWSALSLLLTVTSAVPEGEFTLTDLLQPNANRRLFDTLSAIVASEYEGRPTSLLYESDMVLHPDRLEEIVANSIPTKRRKRKAFVDYMYPRTIWTSGVPYSIHSSIGG